MHLAVSLSSAYRCVLLYDEAGGSGQVGHLFNVAAAHLKISNGSRVSTHQATGNALQSPLFYRSARAKDHHVPDASHVVVLSPGRILASPWKEP